MSISWIPCRACANQLFPGYLRRVQKDREVLVECDCHRRWRQEQTLISRLKDANLPFSDFFLNYTPEKDYLGNHSVIHSMTNLFQEIFNAKESHLYYLIGKPDTQKSTIGCWLGIHAIREHIPTYYIKMGKLLEEIVSSFNEEKSERRAFYEQVKLLIIDDAFMSERTTLYKNNSSYQLSPLNNLLRNRKESSVPKHTILISQTLIPDIKNNGFGNDIQHFMSKQAQIIPFSDEYTKLISRFLPTDIFNKEGDTGGRK